MVALSHFSPVEYKGILKGEARFFSFIAKEMEEGEVKNLELPKGSKVICIYRNNEFILPEEDTKIKKDDEVVILTHSSNLDEFKDKWGGGRDKK